MRKNSYFLSTPTAPKVNKELAFIRVLGKQTTELHISPIIQNACWLFDSENSERALDWLSDLRDATVTSGGLSQPLLMYLHQFLRTVGEESPMKTAQREEMARTISGRRFDRF